MQVMSLPKYGGILWRGFTYHRVFHGQYELLFIVYEGEVYLIWKSEGGLPLSVNKQ